MILNNRAILPWRPAAVMGQTPAPAEGTGSAGRILAAAGIVVGGALVGLAAWPYHGKPLGSVALGAAGSIMGAGIVLLYMDLVGLGPAHVPA
jgi:hypothetical protein